MGVEFRVLGRVEAVRDGEDVALNRAVTRDLLAVLLLNANRVVSTDRLLDALWNGRRGDDARATLYVYVSRLRSALGPEATLIATESGGYVARVDEDMLDAARFERLVREGRRALAAGRPDDAAAMLDEALALWGGPAYDGVEIDTVRLEAARLDDVHAEAVEVSLEATLASGLDADLVPRISEALRTRPYRERLWELLMLALYRTGRQADALATYRRARETLVEKLGLEPSPRLQRLQAAILRHDPSLDDARRPASRSIDTRTLVDVVSRATALLPSGERARVALLPELGECLMDIGEWDAAGRVLDEAVHEATELDEPLVEAQARVARIRLRLRTDPSADLAELARDADAAVTIFSAARDDAHTAEAWSVAAAVAWRGCRADATERALEHAVVIAQRAGDARAVNRAYHLLIGCAVLGPLPVPRALARCDEILALPDPTGRLREAALRGAAMLHAMAGDFEAAREAAAEQMRLATAVGGPVVTADALSIHGTIELYADDLDAAETLLRQGYGMLGGMGEQSMRAVLAAQLARVSAAQARTDEALAWATEAEAAAAPSHLNARVIALGARARALGDAEQAFEAVALAATTDFATLIGDAELDLAETLASTGDVRAADASARALAQYERKQHAVGAALAQRHRTAAAA